MIGDSQDPLNQYPGYISYAASNPYHPLVSQSVIDQANTTWFTPVIGCKDQVKKSHRIISSSKNEKIKRCRLLRATMEALMQYVLLRKASVTLIFLVHWLGIMM